jgi:hypothetical protein
VLWTRACCDAQDGNTIAVRAAGQLQIFNLELGKKVKSHKMPDDKVVQYWTWISPNTIGVVTDTEVFHWSIDGACDGAAAAVPWRVCLVATRVGVCACVCR